jgi:hypothetical protein
MQRWNGFGPNFEPVPHDLDKDSISARAFGEAMWNLGKIIALFRRHALAVPPSWTAALTDAADFLLAPTSRNEADLFPRLWHPGTGKPLPGTVYAAGVPGILALLAAHRSNQATKRPSDQAAEYAGAASPYLAAAIDLLDRYWKLCGDTFARPFAGSTLDADCEDKEAGIYFFIAASELFQLTGEKRLRGYAEVSADWILTFLYHWDTGFLPGTPCAINGFVATGWSGVSVQNQHLDVFFPAFELYDFGRVTGNQRLMALGQIALEARSHGITQYPGHWGSPTPGNQCEQYFQTNFWQGPKELFQWRGGFNPFNPSWIIALVLEGALRFDEARSAPARGAGRDSGAGEQ